MTDKNLPPDDRTKPPNKDEWPWVWDQLDKSGKSWIITKPFHAAVTNWKAWLAIAAVTGFIKGDDLILLLQTWFGGGS